MSRKIMMLAAGLLYALLAQAQGTPMKIMTFNIRYNNPGDSIFNWDHRKDMVFAVFGTHQPDIAGCQEVLAGQLNDMKAGLKDYTWYGVGRDDGDKAGEFCPIGFRTSRFVRIDGSTFWLSLTPDVPGSRSWKTACTRIVTWVMLRDRQTMQLFFVFNTHFDHGSEEARVESARLLRKKIEEITSGRPAFITGDFNATSEDKAYYYLTEKSSQNYLTDTRLSVPDSLKKPSYSFIGFPFNPENGNLIDFIFTRNVPGWTVTGYRIITDNRNGQYPSDHLPVLVTFSYSPVKK